MYFVLDFLKKLYPLKTLFLKYVMCKYVTIMNLDMELELGTK